MALTVVLLYSAEYSQDLSASLQFGRNPGCYCLLHPPSLSYRPAMPFEFDISF